MWTRRIQLLHPGNVLDPSNKHKHKRAPRPKHALARVVVGSKDNPSSSSSSKDSSASSINDDKVDVPDLKHVDDDVRIVDGVVMGLTPRPVFALSVPVPLVVLRRSSRLRRSGVNGCSAMT